MGSKYETSGKNVKRFPLDKNGMNKIKATGGQNLAKPSTKILHGLKPTGFVVVEELQQYLPDNLLLTDTNDWQLLKASLYYNLRI